MNFCYVCFPTQQAQYEALAVNFKRINVDQAQQLMLAAAAESPPQNVQIVDIRDDQAFAAGHIETALHLHNANLQEFIHAGELDAPLLVYCYHGHMSQSAAAYLAEQGFSQAYSLDGGYEAWDNR